MGDLKELERAGTFAVKQLRLSKLKHGIPFMINSKELPDNQCYLEFPDGKIFLVTLDKSGMEFARLRELTLLESNDLRKRFDLEEVA